MSKVTKKICVAGAYAEHKCSFVLGKYLGAGLLGHMVKRMLAL